MNRWHLAILRIARLLAPQARRDEWFAEWRAELWYVDRAAATAFCLGSFKDALWLRRHTMYPPLFWLDSPLRCLAVLALLTAAGLLLCAHLPVDHDAAIRSTYPDAQNLVLISRPGHRGAKAPTIRVEEYQAWTESRQRLFTSLAFYQPSREMVTFADGRQAELSIMRASRNLFQLLRIPVPFEQTAALVLTEAVQREFFDPNQRIYGRAVEIDGHPVRLAGVIPPDSWRLPGRTDAWLLDDQFPAESKGFVLAHVRQPTHRMIVPNDTGGADRFDCVPLAGRIPTPLSAFLLTLAMSLLLLPVTTSLSLGEYPPESGTARWIYLAVKLILILVMIYCGACYVTEHGTPVHGLFVGSILALRWVLVDQRRRCPVCLRLVSNPVHFGQPSQTFLAWYGTEFICARGHGFLHVAEIPTSCYSSQRWLCLR
jgi:hypothetical protein